MTLTLELLAYLAAAAVGSGGVVAAALGVMTRQNRRTHDGVAKLITDGQQHVDDRLAHHEQQMDARLVHLQERQDANNRELHDRISRVKQDTNDLRVEVHRTFVTAEPIKELKSSMDRLHGRIDELSTRVGANSAD